MENREKTENEAHTDEATTNKDKKPSNKKSKRKRRKHTKIYCLGKEVGKT